MEPRVLIVAFGVSEVSTLTSISASSLIILPSSFTGNVIVPSSETSAFTLHFAPRSKFVVVNHTRPSFASIKTFCKIGMVFLVPTTLITN